MTCYDCIHCDVCSGIGACSYHCSNVCKCKFFKNKADYAEVKHGEWILRRQSNGVKTHQCSVCGRPIYTIDEDLENYAPYCHCGAKMSVNYESSKNDSE